MRRISKLALTLASRPKSLPEMPDARGPPVLGAIMALLNTSRGKQQHEYIDKCHRTYGPLFRGRVGPVQAIFVSSPEAIREVFQLEGPTPGHFIPEAWIVYNKMRNRKRGLLFMDGEEWLQYRRTMNKIMLLPESVNMMTKPCLEGAQDLVEKWRSYENNLVPNVENQLYQWSIEVLLASLVGSPWRDYKSTIKDVLEELSRTLSKIFDYSEYLSGMSANLARYVSIPWWTGFVREADYVFRTVDQLVEEMVRLEGIEDGLLHLMIRRGLSQEMLQRIVVDLIIAAGDTTAYSMQWLLFLIASKSDIQEKLYQSLQGSDESQMPRDAFLKGVIKESLRLYPTAPFITRILPKDTLLGGYPVRKNEIVVLSMYTCGRDEISFPRAEEFQPERWFRNGKGFTGVINPHATLPFAMGARSCLGRKLAEIQMSITTAELLRAFKIVCLNKDRVTMKLRMVSTPSEPLQLKLTARN